MTRAHALWVVWLGLAGCFPELPQKELPDDRNDDFDGDGWNESEGDCDDTQENVHPCVEDVPWDGVDVPLCAKDVPWDGVDSNCDFACEFDWDGDGHAPLGEPGPGDGDTWTCLSWTDCDDADVYAYPGAAELGGDGTDDDCDGLVDEGIELDLPQSAALVVYGDEAGAWLADTFAVNESGDLVVGAKRATASGAAQAGAVFVVDRGDLAALLEEAPDAPVYLTDLSGYRYDGLDFEDHAGAALAALLDKQDAVVIGAPDRATGGLKKAGSVYYDRGVPADTVVQSLDAASTTVQGVDEEGNLGEELAVGRFDKEDDNGDDTWDLVVAAPKYGDDAGAVYLLSDVDQLGVFAVDDIASGFVDGVMALGEPGGKYGEGLAVLDADADGYDDLVVSSPIANLVHLWRGAEDGLAFGGAPDVEWVGPAAGSTGLVMAALDWDGDGTPELAISATEADGVTEGDSDDGELFLVSGLEAGPLDGPDRVSICRFLGVEERGDFGQGLAGLGDLDGHDGDELLVAARSSSIVYLVSSGTGCVDEPIDVASTWRWKYDEDALDDVDSYAGHALLGLGDLDGGGKDDFVIGHYKADVPVETLPKIRGGVDAGAFYILLGEDLIP